ncbi:hypothetical protein NDU88_009547 [Pleurodeles waltl]|uniref:Uncharacterized protein n=1 Tax=Pleurodeles waltl TaxID=8319 RepID=A0AAV7QRW7_PLEWA|nr:hypothetical protein NDU88_009547 [Pleurodeles waltl]
MIPEQVGGEGPNRRAVTGGAVEQATGWQSRERGKPGWRNQGAEEQKRGADADSARMASQAVDAGEWDLQLPVPFALQPQASTPPASTVSTVSGQAHSTSLTLFWPDPNLGTSPAPAYHTACRSIVLSPSTSSLPSASQHLMHTPPQHPCLTSSTHPVRPVHGTASRAQRRCGRVGRWRCDGACPIHGTPAEHSGVWAQVPAVPRVSMLGGSAAQRLGCSSQCCFWVVGQYFCPRFT